MKSFQDLIKSDTPVLVDFFAEWCGPCKTMSPILKDVAQKLEGKVKIIKVDIDKNPQAANALNVRGVPTFILFKNGEVKWRQSGAMPATVLEQAVTQNS